MQLEDTLQKLRVFGIKGCVGKPPDEDSIDVLAELSLPIRVKIHRLMKFSTPDAGFADALD